MGRPGLGSGLSAHAAWHGMGRGFIGSHSECTERGPSWDSPLSEPPRPPSFSLLLPQSPGPVRKTRCSVPPRDGLS